MAGERLALRAEPCGAPREENTPIRPRKDPTLFGRFTFGHAESIHGRRGLRPGDSNRGGENGRLRRIAMARLNSGTGEIACKHCGAVHTYAYKDFPERDRGSQACLSCGRELMRWSNNRDYFDFKLREST
jgi:hypothetical protein